jgi:hypothetical protein
MIERADYQSSRDIVGAGQANELKVGPDQSGTQSSPPATAPGFWGTQAEASALVTAIQISPEEREAKLAETNALRAYAEFQAARDALPAKLAAAKDPVERAAIKDALEVLRQQAVKAATQNFQTQNNIPGNDGSLGFNRNRFEDNWPVARAGKLLERANGTPIGRAYDAQENVRNISGLLDAARQQWEQLPNGREKAAARNEVVKLKRDYATAVREHRIAWETALAQEISEAQEIGLKLARDGTPGIDECKAGLKNAKELESALKQR